MWVENQQEQVAWLSQAEKIENQTNQALDNIIQSVQSKDPQKAKFLTDLKPVLGKVLNQEVKNLKGLFTKQEDGKIWLQTFLENQPTEWLWFFNFAFRQKNSESSYQKAVWILNSC